jgi:hypothetical protein
MRSPVEIATVKKNSLQRGGGSPESRRTWMWSENRIDFRRPLENSSLRRRSISRPRRRIQDQKIFKRTPLRSRYRRHPNMKRFCCCRSGRRSHLRSGQAGRNQQQKYKFSEHLPGLRVDRRPGSCSTSVDERLPRSLVRKKVPGREPAKAGHSQVLAARNE